jgi:putative methionine-R-sulfoxide reductase with GAF domain
MESTDQVQTVYVNRADSSPADGPAPALQEIPGYEILGELGRGGMGVVCKARQIALKRIVALKMISAGALADPDDVARFRTEAEVVARLQHPNIVQIYEVGEHQGRPYFSLEFVAGGSLAQKLHGRPLLPRQAAELIQTLARAIHYAHEQGIVHRDLKPANILLQGSGVRGQEPGKPVDGLSDSCLLTPDSCVKITDFGLAKLLGEGGQTRSGDILGTPSYMAPEQAGGKPQTVGPAADIYSLGAILYELLTGQPPFAGESFLRTLQQVCHDEPVAPSRRQPKLPPDLETICLKCLHKEPAQRYASAQALADDLAAFLAGEPIQARPATTWERTIGWMRRRPVAAALSGAVCVAVVGLVVGLWWQNALAVSAVAILSLLVAGAWYSTRLQAALRESATQQLRAQRHVERLHLLLELTRKLVSVTDRDGLLLLLRETTARLANAERATIFLLDPERRELWTKIPVEGRFNEVEEIRMPLGVGIAGTVAASGQTLNIPDAYADPRFHTGVDRRTGFVTRNLLAFPMTAADGRVLGVFEVVNKRGEAFGPEDVDALAALAASAAVAVENSYAETQNRVS